MLPSPLPFPLNSAHFCFLHPLLFCFKARLKAAKELVHVEGAFALRSGEWLHIDTACIVSGDVLRIEEGEIVPADGSVALSSPMAVVKCNEDMEVLISDSNRSIATLAITTLLKTGTESR